jgi:hypothetical protein
MPIKDVSEIYPGCLLRAWQGFVARGIRQEVGNSFANESAGIARCDAVPDDT